MSNLGTLVKPPQFCPMHLILLIWHFTESNFTTFVLPNAGFGLLTALAAPLLTNRPNHLTVPSLLLQRLPRVVLFNWANVFVFDLANQRLPESELEDQINKPWRPVPSKQISLDGTRRYMFVAIPAALGISFALGVVTESALILILTWLYNDLHGGDELIRDLIIALGYACYLSSSLRIAVGSEYHLNEQGNQWIAMVSGIVLTTMQIQDLKDQAGDRTRGRKTWPLVLGDKASRRIIIGFVIFWSFACPSFWRLPLWVYLIPLSTGAWVSCCVLQGTNDACAWRWWCAWQVVIYALPSLAQA